MALTNAQKQAAWRARRQARDVEWDYAMASLRSALKGLPGDCGEKVLAKLNLEDLPEGFGPEVVSWLAGELRKGVAG
jgi:hypothetical protein